MPKKRHGWFFDTVSLSNFALIGRVDLLKHRYQGRAWLTVEVLDEVARGIASGRDKLGAIIACLEDDIFQVMPLSPAEWPQYIRLLQNLGSGEASTIVAAQSRNGVVVTDDRAARVACDNLRVRKTGTIGILSALCKDKTITPDEADTLLEQMVVSGFFSPVQKISSIL